MRKHLIGTTVALLLSASVAIGHAEAAPSGQYIFGVDRAGELPSLDRVQFIFGGRNFCWYDNGWRGPGFYWCGYAFRSGYGWGGVAGWNGWRGGGGGSRAIGGRSGGARSAVGRQASGRASGGHAGGGRASGGRGGGHAGGGGHGGGGQKHGK